jgi:general secretion pathway protein D
MMFSVPRQRLPAASCVAFLLALMMLACGVGATGTDARQAPWLSGPALKPEFGRLTVPAFIQRMFVESLGRDVVVSPEVRAMAEPVDLRLESAVTPQQLFRIGRSVLAARGVAVKDDGKMLVFSLSAGGARLPPRVRGTGAPEPQRDVFVQVPLQVVTPVKVGVWLAETLASPAFNVDEDTLGNSVLLSGPPEVVEEALRMVKVLDQPRAVARHGMRIVPRHLHAERLAADLVSILQSEGIAADARSPVSTVIVMPLSAQQAVAVFATRRALLDHVAEWARNIDRTPGEAALNGVFSWPLEHQQAGVVVEALQGLVAGGPAGTVRPAAALPAPPEGVGEEADGADGAAPDSARRPPSPSALAADTNRNAVVFRGPVREWQRLSAQIRAMDVPSSSVLVEVLLVDVRFDRTAGSGLEWLASGSVHGDDVSLGSSGLGLGQDGFNLLLRDGSTVRAALELFAADTRAAVRARPRLVVASGHEARLEVGDEIPVLASSSRSTRRPDAPLVSAVEYRHTGLSLAVRPTVLAGDRVEMEVLQEISTARETASSGIDSPTIRSRRLQTTVSLRDGGAVLLGGLQETAGSASRAGAAALPGPATALDAKTRESGRTELMVLIRPRVLRSPEEAAAVTAGGR